MSDPSQSPSEGRRYESVLGPFTVRDLTLFGGVLITFIGSLLPLSALGFGNLWSSSGLFFIAAGFLVPVAAAALFAWRRLEPAKRLRIGSLSVDQFASVAAVLSASFYFVFAATTLSPGGVVGLLGGLVMLAATTLARLIPPFAVEFEGRAEVPAHVAARDAVAPAPRPRAAPAKPARPDAAAVPVKAAVPADAGRAKTAGTAVGAPGSVPGADGVMGPRPGAASAAPGRSGSSALGTGAGAAAAASAAGAWGSHPGDAWGSTAAGTAEHPGEAAASVPGSGPGTGGPAEPAEIGAADLLASAPTEGETSVLPAGAPGSAAAGPSGPAGGGGMDAGEAQRPVAPPAEEGDGGVPEDAVGGPGAADGEAYGAPEPAADAEAGPATAVFPASVPSPGEAPAQAPTVAAPVQPDAVEPDAVEDIGATMPYDDGGRYEAFWFAVSQPRMAADPSTGQPLFALEPGQWILALQDRGSEFVVQSPDGRVGILRELSGVERA